MKRNRFRIIAFLTFILLVTDYFCAFSKLPWCVSSSYRYCVEIRCYSCSVRGMKLCFTYIEREVSLRALLFNARQFFFMLSADRRMNHTVTKRVNKAYSFISYLINRSRHCHTFSIKCCTLIKNQKNNHSSHYFSEDFSSEWLTVCLIPARCSYQHYLLNWSTESSIISNHWISSFPHTTCAQGWIWSLILIVVMR